MFLFGHVYRFFSNFIFLAFVYFTLNVLEKYQQRFVVAFLVMIYAAMRIVSALGSFRFLGRLELLEAEARRLAKALKVTTRKEIAGDVAALRRASEAQAYMNVMFLVFIVVLCCIKIVT